MVTFKSYIEEALASALGGGDIQEKHGAIRKQPLNTRLKNTLANGLAGTGLDWYSYSGGQPATGVPGVDRKGGPRHDNGNASDGEFVDAIKKTSLDADNPTDRARISNALKKLRDAGIVGFGWDSAKTGKGHYMGSQRFHLDVYGPGVWGFDRSSRTAAPWLIDSIGGMPAGASMAEGDEAEGEAQENVPTGQPSDFDTASGAVAALGAGLDKMFGFLKT